MNREQFVRCKWSFRSSAILFRHKFIGYYGEKERESQVASRNTQAACFGTTEHLLFVAGSIHCLFFKLNSSLHVSSQSPSPSCSYWNKLCLDRPLLPPTRFFHQIHLERIIRWYLDFVNHLEGMRGKIFGWENKLISLNQLEPSAKMVVHGYLYSFQSQVWSFKFVVGKQELGKK